MRTKRFSSSRPSVAGHTNGGIPDGEGKEKDEKCFSGLELLRSQVMPLSISANTASPLRRSSLAGHNIEETTKDAFSSNDEYALINKNPDEDDGDSGFSSHLRRGGSVTSYDTSYDAHPDNPILWGGKGGAYTSTGNGIGGHGPVAMGGNRRTPSGLSMPIASGEDYSYRGAAVKYDVFYVFLLSSGIFHFLSWLGFPFD
ncbi:hypothetical protein B9Z19DRAFT_1067610 [Tuber borchii]|uniref:Uncharacterized protein n=1 Tax=Tuber borchii TaxID=42251 RepID=A0A2T6ZI73_TUBBO|nr:hypothetical protein B9Z19DRAFT_1067610 [Tuber borchii]